MEDWKEYNLGELGTTFSGLSGKTKNDFGSGKPYIPYVNIFKFSRINVNELDRVQIGHKESQSKVKYGDIFFTTSSETIEEVGMSSVLLDHIDEAYLNSFSFGFRLNDFEILLPEFSRYLFRSSKVRKSISDLGRGSTRYNLPKTELKKKLTLKLPSLKEQSLIATILNKVDESIAKTEQLIAKYQHIKTGLMQDLLTKGIDENGTIRSEETHEFKDSPLGRIPVGWECKSLKELYQIKSGSTPLRKRKEYFENGTKNWVKTLDLNEGHIYETEEKITEKALSESSCTLFPEESILIAMYGGWEQIGRTGLLKKQSATNQAISVLYASKREMNSDFVQSFLQYFRYRWKLFAVSTRKDPNISKSDISNFQIVYPKDSKEQSAIQRKISTEKKLISQSESQLLKLQSLKAGLMQDLLSGKVRLIKELIDKYETEIIS